MQFSIIAKTLALAMAAMSVNAAPAPAPAVEIVSEVAASSQPLIDLWKNTDFLDIKFTGSAEVGECKNFAKKFTDIFSSGKAKPGFRCTIWVNKDCKGTGFSFNADPGSASFPSWINDEASSWKCVKA